MNPTEKEVLLEAIEALQKLLRTGVQWNEWINEAHGDGEIELRNVRFPIEIKRNVNQAPAALLVAELNRYPEKRVLVTEYVNPKLGEALRAADQQYIDTAGNAFIDGKGCYVLVVGQKNNWDRTGTAIDANVAFEAAGLKVVYCFLVDPELSHRPYRAIAEVTGAAVGTVGRVINGLETGRFITPKTKGDKREFRNLKKLFDRWLEAYVTKLAPKTDLGTFYIDRDLWTLDLDPGQYNAQWGGETAAANYTNYLKPQEDMLYLPKENRQMFVRDFRARKYDPFVTEERFHRIRLKEKFWTLKEQNYVDPVLVYADLLATDDARNIDTARVLHDRYIQPKFE